jgi:hypothetical protein
MYRSYRMHQPCRMCRSYRMYQLYRQIKNIPSVIGYRPAGGWGQKGAGGACQAGWWQVTGGRSL